MQRLVKLFGDFVARLGTLENLKRSDPYMIELYAKIKETSSKIAVDEYISMLI